MSEQPSVMVDPEFSGFLRALTPDEDYALTGELRREGCRDALVVWRTLDGDILLDGHNRHRICTAENIPYRVEAVTGLETRSHAVNPKNPPIDW